MQVTRIPNDLTGAVWLSQEAGGYGGSRFLHQGGGKHKQSPGIAKAACTALSSAPQEDFLRDKWMNSFGFTLSESRGEYNLG